MASRSYEGPALDGGYQHISEAPAYQDPDGETIDVVDDGELGEERVTNVPDPGILQKGLTPF